jgi:four helix bundle protein
MNQAHKKLDVWKEGVAFASDIYRLTEAFPKSEIYGLTAQMRRAVVSIPSNIAEGAARFSDKEFAQFLNISGGSPSELDTQIEIASNLGYMTMEQKQDLEMKMVSISRKLAGLINKVRERLNR